MSLTSSPTGKFKSQLLYGSAVMIGMRWTMRACGLVSTLVLMRLLAPEDFGIVAMAMVVVAFFEVFTHTSVDLALIREQQATNEHYDTAWTLEIIQATALAGVLLLMAPLATRYFADERVFAVICLLALRAFIGGFENIGVVAFRRDLQFLKEYWFGVTKKAITVALTIVAAFAWQSYWALVIGLVGGRILDVIISYRRHPYRPSFDLSKTRELWTFSRWLLLGRIGDTVSRKLDEFTVGGQLGAIAMGNYFVAADIATAPSDEIVGPMSRGIYPVYSKLLHDRTQLIDSFLLVLGSTAFMCIPLGLGLSAVAPYFVPVVLGAKWLEAIPLIEFLGISGIAVALTTTFEPLLVVSGRAAAFAAFQWIQLALLAPALYFGAQQGGVVGIAFAKTAIIVGVFPLWFLVMARLEAIAARRLAWAIATPLTAGIAMYACVRGAAAFYSIVSWQALVAQIVLGIGVFVAVVAVLWGIRGRPEGPEQQIAMRVAHAWKKIRVAVS